MSASYDRECVRCGGAEYPQEELERVADDERYLPLPERYLSVLLQDGPVCWECMSVAEQRREAGQCVRCGREYDEDSENEDDYLGWITPRDPYGDLLCVSCATDAEAQADAQWFVETVREGKRRAAQQGVEYPPELAAIGEREERWLRARQAQNEALMRAVTGHEPPERRGEGLEDDPEAE